jgi:hypothetical protein
MGFWIRLKTRPSKSTLTGSPANLLVGQDFNPSVTLQSRAPPSVTLQSRAPPSVTLQSRWGQKLGSTARLSPKRVIIPTSPVPAASSAAA